MASPACAAARDAYTLRTTLRSAVATIYVPSTPKDSSSIVNARIVYSVGGHSASAVWTDDGMEAFETGDGFRFLDVPGIGYPVLLVTGVNCGGRQCEYEALYYRFDPASAALKPVPQYDASDPTPPRSGVPCTSVAHPQFVTSLSDNASLTALSVGRTITYATFIVQVPELVVVTTQVTQPAHPSPTEYIRAALPMKFQRTVSHGVLTLTPCTASSS
jgi:hypothetical protein